MADEPKKLRGFAKLSPERRREIAAKGGKSVEPQERAFSKNRELAASAGRVGGSVSPRRPPDGEPE
ncbi:general stress protein [Phenylobacterium sp.]|uniref:general stress protein n=1 Tax=Phenylobacterium sp. TaxID=1871053 RepID=UPI0027312484|nr:KGG domain-containing protein [Phenylobacterium sp.]MDP1598972.1 KGG domain-containing protein [Phenylobacterium sp.]MDP3590399.1 KGG domain-containing protein [Phenylobacterium sp.]